MTSNSSRLPAPAELARRLPAAIAAAGGAISISELEQKLGPDSRMKVQGVRTERDRQLIRETFLDAVRILAQRGSLKWDGETVELTVQGWAQADALGAVPRMQDGAEMSDAAESQPETTIDVRDALQIVEFTRHDGTQIRGYLAEDAERHNGTSFKPPAASLVDQLYPRSEINGNAAPGGFYSTLRRIGVSISAPVLLEQNCRVRLVGRVPEVRGYRSVAEPRVGLRHVGRGGRPSRRPSWERLVCEVMSELGGHASWQDIAAALRARPEVRDVPNWHEEALQAIRGHTTGRGKGYFDFADVGERSVYTLSAAGQKLASRRTVDDRAPTLSKYIATALAPDDAKLTPFEVYALLHLAVELGKPAEAEALYRRLPENFPDEDHYFMLPRLFERAAELAEGDGHG